MKILEIRKQGLKERKSSNINGSNKKDRKYKIRLRPFHCSGVGTNKSYNFTMNKVDNEKVDIFIIQYINEFITKDKRLKIQLNDFINKNARLKFCILVIEFENDDKLLIDLIKYVDKIYLK